WQTFITDLVEEGEIKQGIALNSMQFNLSRVFGPAIGGLSIGVFGLAGSYYLNGLSFIAVIIPLLLIHPRLRVRKREAQSLWSNIVTGVFYIRRRPILQVALGLQLMSAFFVMPYLTLLPIFAGNIYHTGASGLGTMNAVAGAGALAGTVLVLFLTGRLRLPVRALFLLCLIGGLASILFSQMPNQTFTLPLLIILGASTVMANIFTNTTIQSSTPEEIRGRVVSIWVAITFGFAPFGNLVAGSVAQASGAPFTLALGGSVCIVVATTIAFLTRKVARPVLAAV
ncbi:MAG TPA: MFS transporter, partial [Ktedonobacteraceae bacterium]|nr:MFS transporter [Ktedonobacteraceae bacterium]